MLRPEEDKYLKGLPADEAGRIIYVYPYNPDIAGIAQGVIEKLAGLLPAGADIRFMGASALGISGQNDIDIYMLAPENEHSVYLAKLEAILGKQIKHKWYWYEQGYEVSVYLADPESPSQKRQIDMHAALQNSPELLREYEQLKSAMNGKTYTEYQTAKYEFYNKVLGQ